MDRLLVSGLYQTPPSTPFVPGTEAAGVVVAVGGKISEIPAGRSRGERGLDGRLCRADGRQGTEERAVAGGRRFRNGGCGLAHHRHGASTPWSRRHAQTAKPRRSPEWGWPGDVDLAAHLGLRVVAGVGSDDKAGLVRDYGACDVINYRSEDLPGRIKSITGGEGVDICFDNVGGTIFEQMARLMKWGGRLMPIGFTSGQIPSVPMNSAALEELFHRRCLCRRRAEKFPEQAARLNGTLAQLLGEGKICPHIDRILPLEQVKEAMRAAANRTVQGRIVLKVR